MSADNEKNPPSDKNIAIYTAYISKMKELGEQAKYLPKNYVIGLIVPEFFVSVNHGLRVINEMLKQDLGIESLHAPQMKRNVIKKILNKYKDEED